MTRQAVSTNGAPAAIGPYSQGIASGDLVFCSGQLGLDLAKLDSLLTPEVKLFAFSHVSNTIGNVAVAAMLSRPSDLPVVLCGPDAEALLAKAYGRPIVVASLLTFTCSAGCEMCRAAAACVKLRWSANTANAASASVCSITSVYRRLVGL